MPEFEVRTGDICRDSEVPGKAPMQSHLNRHISDLETIDAHVRDLADRAESLVCNLWGPMPIAENVQTEDEPGVMSQCHNASREIGCVLDRLVVAINQLERLV